jgi:hypothetical protein
MVSGMAAITQCDQVGRVIDPTGGTGNQVVNISFPLGAFLAASPASIRVASKNDGANGAPVLKLCFRRREGHSV